MYAGVNGNPTACCNAGSKRFVPRAGFAWSLNDKTVVRGGYGSFWAPGVTTGFATLGYSPTTDYISSNHRGATPRQPLVTSSSTAPLPPPPHPPPPPPA